MACLVASVRGAILSAWNLVQQAPTIGRSLASPKHAKRTSHCPSRPSTGCPRATSYNHYGTKPDHGKESPEVPVTNLSSVLEAIVMLEGQGQGKHDQSSSKDLPPAGTHRLHLRSLGETPRTSPSRACSQVFTLDPF